MAALIRTDLEIKECLHPYSTKVCLQPPFPLILRLNYAIPNHLALVGREQA